MSTQTTAARPTSSPTPGAPRFGVNSGTRASHATESAASGASGPAGAHSRADNGSVGHSVDESLSEWRFSHQWELLELADGSLFFDSTIANHRSVAKPSPALRTALKQLDAAPTSLTRLSELVPEFGDAAGARRVLAPLMREGILVENIGEQVPSWASPELAERFSTQLEWMATLTSEPDDHWRLFERLRNATVAVVGMGGAGSLVAQSLAAAGIGRLIIADGDDVESSNLVRQVLYDVDDCAQPKAERMAERLRRFTPFTEVDVRSTYVTSPQDAADVIAGADFVALCADAPRFVLNRWVDQACKSAAVPYIGALAGCVGPLYQPGQPGCFLCLEEQFRAELGARHDMVVDALASKESWRYPAFVAGPMSVAPIMTTEIVLALTGAVPPATSGGMVRIHHPQATFEPIPVAEGCDCIHRG